MKCSVWLAGLTTMAALEIRQYNHTHTFIDLLRVKMLSIYQYKNPESCQIFNTGLLSFVLILFCHWATLLHSAKVKTARKKCLELRVWSEFTCIVLCQNISKACEVSSQCWCWFRTRGFQTETRTWGFSGKTKKKDISHQDFRNGKSIFDSG